jgi:hypothetical protein
VVGGHEVPEPVISPRQIPMPATSEITTEA